MITSSGAEVFAWTMLRRWGSRYRVAGQIQKLGLRVCFNPWCFNSKGPFAGIHSGDNFEGILVTHPALLKPPIRLSGFYLIEEKYSYSTPHQSHRYPEKQVWWDGSFGSPLLRQSSPGRLPLPVTHVELLEHGDHAH